MRHDFFSNVITKIKITIIGAAGAPGVFPTRRVRVRVRVRVSRLG